MKETKTEAVKTVSPLLKEAANQAEVKGMIDLAERERRILNGFAGVVEGELNLYDAIEALYGVLNEWQTKVDIHSDTGTIAERLASVERARSFISLALFRLEHDDDVLHRIVEALYDEVEALYDEKEELKKLTG